PDTRGPADPRGRARDCGTLDHSGCVRHSSARGTRLRLGAVRLLQSRRPRARGPSTAVGAQAHRSRPGRLRRPRRTRRGGVTPTLADGAVRERIEQDRDSTLFVNAGAGSGRTTRLDGRVVALVMEADVPMRHIAAVTFTGRAGAELRDR